MTETVSLDGRTLVGVENAEQGEVSSETRFDFEQDGDRIYARYSGGDIVDGHLLGTLEANRWEIRYVQLNVDGETASGHSVGTLRILEDGRVRVEDEWEWESKDGTGKSALEEIE